MGSVFGKMFERVITSLAVVGCAYLASTVLVFPVRALARRFDILDRPGPRKCHLAPVARTGGLAVLIALLAIVWGSLWLLPYLRSSVVSSYLYTSLTEIANYPVITRKLWALLCGGLLVAGVGLLDDIKGVGFPPRYKFAGQIAAALVLLPAGIYMDLLNCNHYVSMLVSVVWIVGITNAFNLLDNMDGLASGIALICSFIFLVLVMVKGEFFIALLLSAVIGATLGFFQFNIRGGWIFLGDSGSLLLGYLLGAVSLMATYVDPRDTSLFPVLAPLIILGLPLFDTFSVIVITLRKKRPVFQGDEMQLSHRLVRMGMTMRQAVYFSYLMAFAIALNGLLMLDSRVLHSVIAIVEVTALVAMVTVLMATSARTGKSAASAQESR